jgi:hypothetical protein
MAPDNMKSVAASVMDRKNILISLIAQFVQQGLDAANPKTFPTIAGAFPQSGPETQPMDDGFGHAVASRAGEREGVDQSRAKLIVQLLAQQQTSAMQPGLHGLRAQAQQFRGLLDAHTLDDACDKHGPKPVRQAVDRTFEKSPYLAQGAASLRVGHSRGGKLNDFCLDLSFSFVGPFHNRALPPNPTHGLVQRNPGEPGAETSFGSKLAQMREGADIGFLDDVFGLVVVPHNASGDTKEAAIVPAGEDAHSGFIPAVGQHNQFLIGELSGVNLV